MTLPSNAVTTNFDAGTDDPKAARGDIYNWAVGFNQLLTHLNSSTILSTPLTLGGTLRNNSGALDIQNASTSQIGGAAVASTGQAQAQTDNTVMLTPLALASVTATTTRSGIAPIATQTVVNAATDNTSIVTPLTMGVYVGANSAAVSQQVFTSSGTWTKPAKGTIAHIEGIGAGASGGANSGGFSAGGGGGGSYLSRWILLSSLGSTETVTIGAGGTAVTSTNNGVNGGASSFGAWLTAYGGTGGGSNTSTGGAAGGLQATAAAGSATNDTVNYGMTQGTGGNSAIGVGGYYTGGGGGGGIAFKGGPSIFGGGGGGSYGGGAGAAPGGLSLFAGAGGAGNANAVAGGAGTAPGGGGAGAANAFSGAGAAGRVTVTVF